MCSSPWLSCAARRVLPSRKVLSRRFDLPKHVFEVLLLEEPVVAYRVPMDRDLPVTIPIAERVLADDPVGQIFRSSQGGQEDADEQRDDGDHDEKLDEGETGVSC